MRIRQKELNKIRKRKEEAYKVKMKAEGNKVGAAKRK
jgi:hypothetical protein